MRNLLQPFAFLRLKQPELRGFIVLSAFAAVSWFVVDLLHVCLTGKAINFFQTGGVLPNIATMLSVMVGVYFGLAGVFVASSNPWLDNPMPNGVVRPGTNATMTRGEFFMSLLIYCAAASTVIVFAAAFVPPVVIPILDVVLSTAKSNGFAYGWYMRVALSLSGSSMFVCACAHLFLASLLSFRFLSKSGQS